MDKQGQAQATCPSHQIFPGLKATHRPSRHLMRCKIHGAEMEDVHQFVELERSIVHINHRRRRSEPLIDSCPLPGETQFPARRWVVERTFGWLARQRSILIRCCKKPTIG
jgi:hypothetical protein